MSGFFANLAGVQVSSGGGAGVPVALLANFEGANNDTTYIEESANAESATFNGSAHISSDEAKFGATSAHATGGSGNNVEFPSNVAGYASGAITLEYFRSRSFAQNTSEDIFASLDGMVYVIESYNGANAVVGIRFSGAPGSPQYTATVAAGVTQATGVFYHFYWEIDFDAGTIQGWVDGALVVDATGIADLTATPNGFINLGNVRLGASGTAVNCHIDALRIANGLAGLGGTVPTEAPTINLDEARA